MPALDAFLVWGVAVFFLGMGLVGLVRPRAIPAIFGLHETTAEARSEVRAVYGGFGVMVALALAWSRAAEAGEARGVRLAVAAALVGMAAGRVIGFTVERPKRFYPVVFFLVVELALAIAVAPR